MEQPFSICLLFLISFKNGFYLTGFPVKAKGEKNLPDHSVVPAALGPEFCMHTPLPQTGKAQCTYALQIIPSTPIQGQPKGEGKCLQPHNPLPLFIPGMQCTDPTLCCHAS